MLQRYSLYRGRNRAIRSIKRRCPNMFSHSEKIKILIFSTMKHRRLSFTQFFFTLDKILIFNYSANIVYYFIGPKWQSERLALVYSRFQTRNPEKIRLKLLALSVFLRALHGIYLIPRSSESGALRGALRGLARSSLPCRFLSLTKCLPVLYFTVSSASGKKLTDENLFSYFR